MLLVERYAGATSMEENMAIFLKIANAYTLSPAMPFLEIHHLQNDVCTG